MMNDNHSPTKTTKYLDRWLTKSILDGSKVYPVLVLTGSRQVGKSTFLRNAPRIRNWEYITLDDFETLSIAKKDPEDLLVRSKNLIIDEVQKAPQLLSAIKQAVDNGDKRHFILSGSANILLMHKVSESLAGRAVFYIMSPLTMGEELKQKPNKLLAHLMAGKKPITQSEIKIKEKLEYLIIRGFFPPAAVNFNKLSAILGWLEGFVSTFLERDLRNLAQIDNLPDFRRLMSILALRNGHMLNQTEISRDAKIPQPTVHRYINLLETAHLLEKVPVYSVNRTKRIMKTPKIYWCDTGLASFLMGYHDLAEIRKAKEWGALFENLVFNHLKVWCSLKKPSPKIFYWRATTGEEVDFVIESGKKLIAIEVKSSNEVKYSDILNLKTFLKEYPETSAGIIVYSGKLIKHLGEKLWAVPWEMLT